MKKILLVGCGHMGEALLTSWLKSNNYYVTVIDPIKYNYLKNKYKNKKIQIFKSASKINKYFETDFIIFAVKPFDLKSVLDQFSEVEFKKTSIVISVIAGKRIKEFKNKLKKIKYFFRVMPNLPASIGESMNCITSNKNMSKFRKKQVLNIFNYSGRSIYLKDENEIDMATAISGSGPGFVFNLIDAMEKAAIGLGFNKNIARTLVLQTFKGSVNLIHENKKSAKDLVKSVATKGGTTEAGLKVMNKKNLHKLFLQLTSEAFKRAKDQGK